MLYKGQERMIEKYELKEFTEWVQKNFFGTHCTLAVIPVEKLNFSNIDLLIFWN